MKTAYLKTCLGLVGLAAFVITSPASAVSLKGKATQFNAPTSGFYGLSAVAIADGGGGKFGLLWGESIDFDAPFDFADRVRFRAYSATGATALGAAKAVVGPTNKAPNALGVQSLGASNYQAIWSDRINGTSAGQPIYQQKFNGNTAVGSASVLRADALNKVSNPSFARLNDGTGLLVTSCICFPVIYTGQKIDKTGKLSATATTLSQSGGDVTLGFGAVGGSSVLGAYLKDSTNLAIRVFSGALAPIGPLRNLPILTDPDEVESQRQIGTVGNKIYSLYETLSADKRRFDINGRHSGTNLTGSNKYKAFLKNTDGLASAEDLSNGDLLIAYKMSGNTSIFVARYSSSFTRVGPVAEIKTSAPGSVRRLQSLSNGDVIIVYEAASGKGLVQRLKP